MEQNLRLRLLSYVVIAYMLLAFTWWAVLLFTKNMDAFYAKRDIQMIEMMTKGLVKDKAEYEQTADYQKLARKYQLQEWMIFGEAGVFIVTLIIGIWLINRGYREEMVAAQQRRNFLLSITHELKSPIASIRLIIETFVKRNLSKEQMDSFSKSALKETDRLNKLVNDLLLSAKLETAYQPYFENLDLNAFLSEIVATFSANFPGVQIKFQKNDSNPIIRADKVGLTSLTLNLLENAVKYSGENPKIELLQNKINGALQLEFRDQGIGILDKEKKKIFEKFYRVGNEDTRQTKGTGLGLFIVNQVVKAHKGKILVLNNQPKGTIFRIELPSSESESERE